MSNIEHQILDALARNTALLQRRADRAAARARDAFDEYQRQQRLLAGGRR